MIKYVVKIVVRPVYFAFKARPILNPISPGLYENLLTLGGHVDPLPKSHRNAVERLGFGVIIK